MKIGFGLPVAGSWATAANIGHIARRAEELGYHELWTFQRLVSPPDGSWGETYRSVLDPLLPLALAAAHTSTIRLGVAVLNMPFISPPLLAKQTASLDVLCGGRLDVGLGLGWADEEYVASGATKQRLKDRAEEFIEVLRSLWTDDIVTHDGEFYRVPGVTMLPKPVQRPHPPILIGGGAPAALRRAGRLGDGWVSSSRADLLTIGESVRLVANAAARAGRDPQRLRFICRGSVRVRPSGVGTEPRPRLTGTVDQIREDLAHIAEQGITELFVDLNFDPEVGSPDADPSRSLERAEAALTAFAPTR